MARVKGGKAIYGAALGILMLEARFPRIPGDMGNALTWPFPVLYRVVRGASPDRVVRRRAEGLLDAFIAAARELVADGAEAITSNCGYLSLFQQELAAAVNVPVAVSSLMQVPLVERCLPPGRRAGVLTVSAASLTAEHLVKAGADPTTPVAGTAEEGEFVRTLLGNLPDLDVEAARADNVAAARSLVERHPEVAAIVLECTNMVPYAPDIRRATGRMVHSVYDLALWLNGGLVPRSFPQP